jgi:hypothetical protein
MNEQFIVISNKVALTQTVKYLFENNVDALMAELSQGGLEVHVKDKFSETQELEERTGNWFNIRIYSVQGPIKKVMISFAEDTVNGYNAQKNRSEESVLEPIAKIDEKADSFPKAKVRQLIGEYLLRTNL